VTEQEILENHERFAARTALLRKFGYDSDRANAFILSQAHGLDTQVLEIGSGKGRFLVALLLQGPSVTSVDIDYSEQRFARLNVAYAGLSDRVRFLQADATRLPFRDAGFRTVVSVNALHHFPDWRPLLSELFRLVDPLGTLILADFSEDGYAVLDRLYSAERKVHPRVEYRVDDVCNILTSRGWRIHIAQGECQWVLTATRLQRARRFFYEVRPQKAVPHAHLGPEGSSYGAAVRRQKDSDALSGVLATPLWSMHPSGEVRGISVNHRSLHRPKRRRQYS